MVALDKDRDGELSRDEIADAPKALKTLDKNGDGILSHEELRPTRPHGPRRTPNTRRQTPAPGRPGGPPPPPRGGEEDDPPPPRGPRD